MFRYWHRSCLWLALLLGASPILAEDMVAVSCCEDGECACECGDDLLFGLFARSERNYCDFISPMTNPVFFEDPRTLTEARFIFLNHRTPNALGGDNVQLVAMQARAALTEDLSIIATKDGFITSQSPLLEDGWADVAIGLKYNLYKDCEGETIVSGGITFELPIGSTRALQGNGDGEFNLFVTGGTRLMEDIRWVSAAGIRLPCDSQAENQVCYWSNHVDRRFFSDNFYGFLECNWYHWMKDGTAFLAPVEGVDLFNLGAPGIAGNNIVTGAYGVKYRFCEINEVGVAYEVPLSEREGLLANRIQVDLILRY